MSSSDEIARADLNRRVRAAERVIRRLVRGMAALALACLILICLVVWMLRERSDARNYYNDKIQQLVCGVVALAPSHQSPITDRLRAGYHCPPYKPHGHHRRHTRRTG